MQKSTSAWHDAEEFREFIFEWADHLPPGDIPPREGKFARYAGCSSKTVVRWLGKIGCEDWEEFVRVWTLHARGNGA